MRVRPLITCLMSEIETFLCFLTTGLIFTVLIIIECTSGFYIRARVVIIYIFISGIIMFVYKILYIHFMIRFRLFRVFSYKSFI